jgi:hypothetical protein
MRLHRPNIDRSSLLWQTCAHEAAHYHLRKRYGFEPRWPLIVTPGVGAVHWTTQPELEGMRGVTDRLVAYMSAMASMAGPVTSEKFEWFPGGCDTDMRNVRHCLKLMDHVYTEGEIRAATRLAVNNIWREIERTADILCAQYLAVH